MHVWVQDFLDWCSARPQSDSTVNETERRLERWPRYGADLDLIITDKDEGQAHVQALARRLQRERGANVAKRFLNDANNLAKWAYGDEAWTFKLPKVNAADVRLYSQEELRQLRDFTFPDPLRTLREHALLDISTELGLRRVEASRINRSDFDFDKGILRILRPAKGGCKRDLPLSKRLLDERSALRSWLRASPMVRDDPEAVWISLHGRIRRLNRKYPKQAEGEEVGSVMQAFGKAAGIRANFVRGRHYCLQDIYDRTHDLYYVAKWAGWNSIERARIYVNLHSQDLLDRHQKMNR